MPKATLKTTTKFFDPIFERIEVVRRLQNHALQMARDADLAGIPVGSADPVEQEVDRAWTAAEWAAERMARTRPTTVAGAAAMLAYIIRDGSVGLFEIGEHSWHEAAIDTVIAALSTIA